ncbi:hypothetical protein D5S17_35775 [Pseudonocardiaceae bacterium YIM PH 21723]|nr:hypothetical protein D5S17_35775 [Pseudonocardiaceae bacterium YIM PH 21723]
MIHIPAPLGTTPGAQRAEDPEQVCGERLTPVPPDRDHPGWTCIRHSAHLPHADHRALDGTTW